MAYRKPGEGEDLWVRSSVCPGLLSHPGKRPISDTAITLFRWDFPHRSFFNECFFHMFSMLRVWPIANRGKGKIYGYAPPSVPIFCLTPVSARCRTGPLTPFNWDFPHGSLFSFFFERVDVGTVLALWVIPVFQVTSSVSVLAPFHWIPGVVGLCLSREWDSRLGHAFSAMA